MIFNSIAANLKLLRYKPRKCVALSRESPLRFVSADTLREVTFSVIPVFGVLKTALRIWVAAADFYDCPMEV